MRACDAEATCFPAETGSDRRTVKMALLNHLRHWPDQNSAVQQSRTPPWCVLFLTAAVHGPAAPLSIQNNSGLSQGLAGRSAAGSACGKPTKRQGERNARCLA